MNIVDVNDISEFLIVSPNTSKVPGHYFSPVSESSLTTTLKVNAPSTLGSTLWINKNNKEVISSHWTREHSLILIDSYKMYRNKVGQMEMKSFKKMWEVIAASTLEKYKVRYTAQNCENRWRVLERNYKKYVENSSKTGRKYFEFSKEMDEIFKKKRNIHPEILLTLSDVIKPSQKSKLKPENPEDVADNERAQESVEILGETQKTTSNPVTTPILKRKRLQNVKYRRDTILQQIQIDRKHYQEESLKLENFKIAQMLKIQKEKLEIKKKHNELLKIKINLLEKNSNMLPQL